ncbi:EAL domain-containing protein [Mesorhizobium amorphae]|uniref:EAL domain-containing protein n=1 Tax=Mesorhizobium amorphae TaxID=71433 RepID=UPI0031F4A186
MIKVDATLTRGVDSDPGRYALIAGLVTFANVLGSQLVAEGVETNAELEMLQKAGVQLAQGFFLGKPKSILDALAVIGSPAIRTGRKPKRTSEPIGTFASTRQLDDGGV